MISTSYAVFQIDKSQNLIIVGNGKPWGTRQYPKIKLLKNLKINLLVHMKTRYEIKLYTTHTNTLTMANPSFHCTYAYRSDGLCSRRPTASTDRPSQARQEDRVLGWQPSDTQHVLMVLLLVFSSISLLLSLLSTQLWGKKHQVNFCLYVYNILV